MRCSAQRCQQHSRRADLQCAAAVAADAIHGRAVRAALMYPALDAASIWRHITTVEDTQALRDALPGLGLVGFAGDGAILPRKRCVCAHVSHV